LGSSKEQTRKQAEKAFAKQEKASDAAAGFKADREAEGRALDAKTARLKSLRVAKEASDANRELEKPGRGRKQ
jgi:hypothetical protein